MSNTVQFACKISTTDPQVPLALEILLDGASVFKNSHVEQDINVEFAISDDEAKRRLEFVLSGKTPAFTQIDSAGNIVKDALLTISEITIDEIELDNFVFDIAKYTHNFNGNGQSVEQKFFGNVGCNGTVTFDFSTPIYLWLLENL